MRFILLLAFSFILYYPACAQTYSSPLSRFSQKWDDIKYLPSNTAKHADYMSDSEKKVIYILNMARMNPKLFCETVLKRYPEINSDYDYKSSGYFSSLITTLSKMEPLGMLLPDSACWYSAYAHASSSGATGYVGHDRQTAKAIAAEHFRGECCDYGHNMPLDIVMSLLIDQDVESLGHRKICLGAYGKMGVAIHSHTEYRFTATLDFYD